MRCRSSTLNHQLLTDLRSLTSALRLLCVLCVLLRLNPSVAADTNTPGNTFHGVFYPTGTLGYVLESNYHRITNSIPGYQVWNDQPWLGFIYGNTNVAGYRFNPKSAIYRKRGATALSIVQFNSTQNHLCAVTRRHAIGIAHFGTGEQLDNQTVWFMGTNGLLHAMRTTNCFADKSLYKTNEDIEVIQFTQDLPPDVEVMRVLGPLTNSWRGFAAYFPPSNQPEHLPNPFFCQHGYIGRGGQPHPNGVIGDGGDSGSPTFTIYGDELINVGGMSPPPSPLMQRKIDELSRKAGLDPAKYQMQVFYLTNYPKWPY